MIESSSWPLMAMIPGGLLASRPDFELGARRFDSCPGNNARALLLQRVVEP